MVTKYIILATYFLILFLIGVAASKRVKGLSDFYVGGKSLGYWAVAFSARATGESAWLLLGLTGLGATMGVASFWVVLGELLGVIGAWFFMAKRFKRLTDKYDSITVPDFLASRFQTTTHTIRTVAAIALSVFVTIYVSAQIDATGKAFENFLDWNYYSGAIIGFGIVMAYIFSGGFVAVVWSDLFQGIVMLVCLVALPIVAYFQIPEGESLIEGIRAIDPTILSIWGHHGPTLLGVFTIIGFLLFGVGFLGSPQMFVRFISIKDEAEIDKGKWVAVAFTILTDGAAVCIGLLGRYLFTDLLQADGENVLQIMVDNIMPITIIGIYLAAIISAIMSTIDSLLIVASSAVTRDFYQKIYHPHLKNESLTTVSRIVTIILSLTSLAIALSVAYFVPDRTVFWFVIFGWSGISATFCPVMILSLFWKGYTAKGAIASMITGFMAVPFFKFVAPTIPNCEIFFETLTELPPSFAISLLVGFIVSKAYPNKELEQTTDFK